MSIIELNIICVYILVMICVYYFLGTTFIIFQKKSNMKSE
jgi:hypothetical protein